MKNFSLLILFSGLLILSGCKKKECWSIGGGSLSYKSENFEILTPQVGIFALEDSTRAILTIEGVDLINDIEIDQKENYISSPNSKSQDKIVTEITISYFHLTEESEIQIIDPIENYVEKFELFIHTNNSTQPHNSQDYDHGLNQILLGEAFPATYVPPSNGSGGSGTIGGNSLDEFILALNTQDLLYYIQANPNYSIELVATFHKVPDHIRVFSYAMTVGYKMSNFGKCK